MPAYTLPRMPTQPRVRYTTAAERRTQNARAGNVNPYGGQEAQRPWIVRPLQPISAGQGGYGLASAQQGQQQSALTNYGQTPAQGGYGVGVMPQNQPAPAQPGVRSTTPGVRYTTAAERAAQQAQARVSQAVQQFAVQTTGPGRAGITPQPREPGRSAITPMPGQGGGAAITPLPQQPRVRYTTPEERAAELARAAANNPPPAAPRRVGLPYFPTPPPGNNPPPPAAPPPGNNPPPPAAPPPGNNPPRRVGLPYFPTPPPGNNPPPAPYPPGGTPSPIRRPPPPAPYPPGGTPSPIRRPPPPNQAPGTPPPAFTPGTPASAPAAAIAGTSPYYTLPAVTTNQAMGQPTTVPGQYGLMAGQPVAYPQGQAQQDIGMPREQIVIQTPSGPRVVGTAQAAGQNISLAGQGEVAAGTEGEPPDRDSPIRYGNPDEPSSYTGGRGNTWQDIDAFLRWIGSYQGQDGKWRWGTSYGALTPEQIAAVGNSITLPSVGALLTLIAIGNDATLQQMYNRINDFWMIASGLTTPPRSGGGGGGQALQNAQAQIQDLINQLQRMYRVPAGWQSYPTSPQNMYY